MSIIDLKAASEKDRESSGVVYIATEPQVRSGKRNDFMVGEFMSRDGSFTFKIWEERIFSPVVAHGPGLYEVDLTGSEFNGEMYLTVRRIRPLTDSSYSKHDFLPEIPQARREAMWHSAMHKLAELGLSKTAEGLIHKMLDDSTLGGRFFIEGAAVRHHDNKIGGLMYHTAKILNLLAALLENNPELKASIDLLTIGIVLHDVGKVFEYSDLSPSEFWYANHRVRGIEFLTRYKDELVLNYDEAFYRQVQSIIIGHHGDYGDRPTTVAAAIVHYLDNVESQVTGLVATMLERPGEKLRVNDWGYLQAIKLKA